MSAWTLGYDNAYLNCKILFCDNCQGMTRPCVMRPAETYKILFSMTSCLYYYHECTLYSPKCLTGLCAKVHQKNFMKLIKPGTFPVKWNQLKSKSAQSKFYFYYFLSQSLQRLKEKYMSIFTHFPRNLIFNQISSANPSRHWSLRSKATERLTLKFNIPHK